MSALPVAAKPEATSLAPSYAEPATMRPSLGSMIARSQSPLAAVSRAVTSPPAGTTKRCCATPAPERCPLVQDLSTAVAAVTVCDSSPAADAGPLITNRTRAARTPTPQVLMWSLTQGVAKACARHAGVGLAGEELSGCRRHAGPDSAAEVRVDA